jgi:hypothetical protein
MKASGECIVSGTYRISGDYRISRNIISYRRIVDRRVLKHRGKKATLFLNMDRQVTVPLVYQQYKTYFLKPLILPFKWPYIRMIS